MCGIVGMAGNLFNSEMKMFRDMLIVDVLRGKDSTGVVKIPFSTNKPMVEKAVGTPEFLWGYGDSQLFDTKGVMKISAKALIGHNRAATVGKVTEDNAHPFTFGDVTGVHNGTLYDWSDLEGYKDFDVDSKALLKTINDKGIEHTWKSFTGAAAVVWWNEKEGTINLIRNNQRPLHVAYSEKSDAIFWASEAWMVRDMAARNNIKLRPRKDEKGNPLPSVYMLAADTFTSFKVNAANVELVKSETLEKKPHPTTRQVSAGSGTTKAGGNGTHTNTKTTKTNVGWADFLSKGDKSLRGQIISVVNFLTKFETIPTKSGGSRTVVYDVMICRMKDGTKVEVYPDTIEMLNSFRERFTRDSCDVMYKLEHRPRVKTFPDDSFVYRVSGSGVSLSHYIMKNGTGKVDAVSNKEEKKVKTFSGYSGVQMTKEELETALKNCVPSCACAYCADPLSVEDGDEIHWQDPNMPICKNCMDDPWTYNYVFGYGKGN